MGNAGLVNLEKIENLGNLENMSSSTSPQSPVLGFLTVISDAQAGLFGGYLVLNWAGRPLEFHCTAPIKPNRAQQILYGPTLEPYLYGEQIGRALVSRSQHTPSVICTDVAAALALRAYVDWPMVFVCSPVGGISHPTPTHPPTTSFGNLGPPLTDGPLSRATSDEVSGTAPSHRETSVRSTEVFQNDPSDLGASADPPKEVHKSPRMYHRLDPPHPGLGRLLAFCWGGQQLAVLENAPQDFPQVQEVLAHLDASFDLAEPFGRIRDAIEEARRGG